MNSAAGIAIAILVLGSMLYLPKRYSLKRRLVAGLALFALGCAGIYAGLALQYHTFMESDVIAYTWVGGFVAVLVLSIILLVPASLEWLRVRRPRRSHRERWPDIR